MTRYDLGLGVLTTAQYFRDDNGISLEMYLSFGGQGDLWSGGSSMRRFWARQ